MEQELLFRYFRGETSQEEEERILSWVEASPANRAEFRKAHLLIPERNTVIPGAVISRIPSGENSTAGGRAYRILNKMIVKGGAV